MNDELTIDMALPEPMPVRFNFGDRFPELAFKIKTEYSIKESKRIQWLGRTWANYFNMPDTKLKDSDHRKAEKSMSELMEIVALDFDTDAFEALPEMLRMRIINKVYEQVGEVMGSDDSEEGDGPNPNGLDWGDNLAPLRAPMADASAIG